MFIVKFGLFMKIYDFICSLIPKPKKDFSSLNYLPQIGDCILIEADNIISDGIQWFSSGDVNHAAVYLGGGKRKIIEALMDGVKVKTLDKYYNNKYTIYIRRIRDLKVEQAEQMKNLAYEYVDRPYDFIQFITLAFYFIAKKLGIRREGLVADSKDAIICSELFNVLAKRAGIKLFKKVKDSVVTPHDLLKCKRMDTIIKI